MPEIAEGSKVAEIHSFNLFESVKMIDNVESGERARKLKATFG